MITLEKVYIVSLPIGNLEDISLRALRILQESEALIVENFKKAKKQLDLLNINSSDKTLFLLNSKNHGEEENLLNQLMFKYKKVSLISDAGAPVFEDPGQQLINKLIEFQIKFTFIPGANALIATLVLSGFNSTQFFYAGFLPQKKPDRLASLKRHLKQRNLLVIFETPYRLNVLIAELYKVFPSGIKVAIALALTTQQEIVFRGRLDQAFKKYANIKNKLPFVLILDNRSKN